MSPRPWVPEVAVGRIRFITIKIGLTEFGYEVSVAVFDDHEVIRREAYDRLSWREAQQVADACADAYRPGLELLSGGVQDTLF